MAGWLHCPRLAPRDTAAPAHCPYEPRRGVRLQAVLQARARKPLTLHVRHSPHEAMARYKPCAGGGEVVRRAGSRLASYVRSISDLVPPPDGSLLSLWDAGPVSLRLAVGDGA